MKDHRLPKKLLYGELSQGQAFPRRLEKALQRQTEGLNEIFRYSPYFLRISGAGQRQVAWSCQTKSESLWKAATELRIKLRKGTAISASGATILCSHCSRFLCLQIGLIDICALTDTVLYHKVDQMVQISYDGQRRSFESCHCYHE